MSKINPEKEKQVLTNEISEYVKEFLKHNNCLNTLKCFDAEMKTL